MKVNVALISGFCFVLLLSSPAWAKKEKKILPQQNPPKALGQNVLGSQWSQALATGGSSKRFYPESASPLLFDNRVYVGTHSGIFYALDPSQKGHIVWQFKSNGPIASQAVSDGSRIYFGNNKGTVYALDASSGQPVWEHFVGGEILAQPALSGGVLYVVTTSREVYALDAPSGDEKWSQFIRGFEKKFTIRGNASLTVSGNSIYAGFADGQIACLSSKGDIVWTRFLAEERTAFKDLDSRVIAEGNALYAVGYYGFVARLDAKSGDIVWKRGARSGSDMAIEGNSLFVTTSDSKVLAFDKSNGTPLWNIPLNSGPLSAPHIIGNYLLVGTQEHGAYVLSSDGEVLQRLSVSPGFIGNPSGHDESLAVLSSSGRVHALGPTRR